MASERFNTSLLHGAHARMARMAGEWSGSSSLWFEPGSTAIVSAQHGSLRPVLGGRYLLHEYVWEFEGEPRQGLALLGYHLDDGQWECAWVDSFHTSTFILFSQAERTDSAEAGAPSVLGSYGDGQTPPGPRWGWRTEIEQPDDDHLLIRMTNITPEGEEAPAVEVRYARVR